MFGRERRSRQNDVVELEDLKLIGGLFHNLGPLTLSHPLWLWVGWFVDESKPWDLKMFENVCASVLSE